MRKRLDLIEARLQSLIESSIALVVRGDSQQRLAHELVEAAQANLHFGADDQTFAPDLYTIYLHPSGLSYWRANPQLLETLSHDLQQAAREYGIHFQKTPVMFLQMDEHIPLDGLRVEASYQPDEGGHTAAFTIAPPAAPGSMPHNAFLIVDGERVFPLNNSVANIGRREDNHLVLSDLRVSRTHAQIRAVRGQYVLFDLNSTGGTMVNGRRVHQCALKPGDVISLSGVPLIYGEETPDDDTYQMGFTQSMNQSDHDEPEVIE